MSAGIVVIGAGQAGGRAVEALRANGYTGGVTLIGAEPHLPYQRPPLSKEMLLDTASERIDWVRPAGWYEAQNVVVQLGSEAVRIDREAKRVMLRHGAPIDYDQLVITTGAAARQLSITGFDHPRCFTIRTLEDSRALRRLMVDGARIVVIGAGFIGLEAAAAARSHGCRVTVLEQGPRVMARGVPACISEIYQRLHRQHGVDLRLDVRITAITGEDVACVHLADGTYFDADAVVVGIGVVPRDELASDAGIVVDNGIVTDDHGRSSDPLVWAAGDVSRHWNPLLGRTVRLESWQNAQNQAIAVGRNLAGHDTIYAEVPWFWSDQYGINLQITGIPTPGAVEVVRGDLDAMSGLLFEVVDNRLRCAIGLNAARDLRLAKQIIGLDVDVDPEALADPAVKLVDLYRAMKSRSEIPTT